MTEVEGYTTVKQMDPTTQQICIYQSDALFHGEKIKHWALFTFDDTRQRPGTLNAGMILGFVKIKARDAKVAELHVVARCSADYQNFNKTIVTK